MFQFWHGTPPDDVAAMMAATRAGQPGFDHVRLDDCSGRAFVEAHYGARGAAAFDACALPAMRSDMVRLMLMDVHGGLYADATYRFAGDLRDLMAETPVALIPAFGAMVVNNLLLFKAPGRPFVRACIALLLDTIARRRFDSALMVTGPGVLNGVRAAIAPDEAPGIVGLGSMNADWMRWGCGLT